jgi:NAD(P)-dependent dehydrogenase (short-subunit alcohol dehydrogenase family)
VAATARGRGELEKLAAGSGGKIFAFPADVSDTAAMAATLEAIEAAHGPVARAVFNAGIYLPVDGLNPEVDLFRRSFDVNLMGTVNGLVPAIARMKARKRGQIVIVSSVTGYGGLPTSSAYGATKAALINMAEALKFDLDRVGVLIQVVNPGFVKTPATDSNPFPMPFLVPVETAAARIAAGMNRTGFEITFPRRFTWMLKALRLLPYRGYFAVVGRMTGWAGKKAE